MDEHQALSALELKFPRIAERIVQLWNKTELDLYLNELMIDDRGNRHGFPEEVASEILFLRMLHDYYILEFENSPDARTVWNNPQYTKSAGHDGVD